MKCNFPGCNANVTTDKNYCHVHLHGSGRKLTMRPLEALSILILLLTS